MIWFLSLFLASSTTVWTPLNLVSELLTPTPPFTKLVHLNFILIQRVNVDYYFDIRFNIVWHLLIRLSSSCCKRRLTENTREDSRLLLNVLPIWNVVCLPTPIGMTFFLFKFESVINVIVGNFSKFHSIIGRCCLQVVQRQRTKQATWLSSLATKQSTHRCVCYEAPVSSLSLLVIYRHLTRLNVILVSFVRPLDALKRKAVEVGELRRHELFCDDAFLSGATSYRYIAGPNGATVQRAVARCVSGLLRLLIRCDFVCVYSVLLTMLEAQPSLCERFFMWLSVRLARRFIAVPLLSAVETVWRFWCCSFSPLKR